MNYFVYILYSFSHQKSYVGYTNDLERRIWEHNNHPQQSFTSRFRPWVLVYKEEFETKKEALYREKWFKSGVGRELKAKLIKEYLNL